MRKLAPQTPICFIPNGVNPAQFDDLPRRTMLEEQCPELIGKFVLLFFARVHVKKGLDLLVEALTQIAPTHPELHIVIAGKDDGALKPFCSRMADLGLSRMITYLGHVAGHRARRVWAAADAFILPSYSEGFSMAILEAMACRLPCLITTSCHFPEAAASHAAIVVTPDIDAVTRGLHELLDRSSDERTYLGLTGRQLIESRYTWNRQAKRLEAVYEWLLGGGQPPEVVIR